jgi:hypothetical protein
MAGEVSGVDGMSGTQISLSLWEREGARSAQPSGKGEGDRASHIALTLPPLRGSLPLPMGEGM